MIYLTKLEKTYSPVARFVDGKYPQRAHIIESSLKRLKAGMAIPTHRLVDDLADEVEEYVCKYPVGRTALIFAAGTQTWNGNQCKYGQDESNEMYYSMKSPIIGLTNVYAGRLASIFRAHDHVSTDASACASSLKVMMDVKNLIDNYGFDRVIVVAGEESVNATILDLFGDLGVSLQETEVQRGIKPSAFDPKNGGFFLGQGAAIAVFENADVCKVEPVAKLLAAYSASEHYANALGQRDDGAGFVKAIEGVLRVGKIDKSEVHLVKTHGTGTLVNNAAEKTALLKCLPEFVATAYKPRIGHTMGISGLLETGLLLDDLKSGFVPAIPNRTDIDSVFLSEAVPVPDGPILSLAAGMGNIYSAALFSREV